jgi:glycosyltransferase involved in cell wall biosynthesis
VGGAGHRDGAHLQGGGGLKILELGKFYPPVRGGIETLLKSLSEGFVRKGEEVECVVANENATTVAETINGVKVRRLRSFGRVFSTSICPGYMTAAREAGAKIWHTHFPNPLADLATLRAPNDARIVITYHSDVIRQAAVMCLYGGLVKRCLRRADKIVVASPRHIEFSKWLQPVQDKCVVIPFGIEAKRFEVGNSPARAKPILLTVGRLVGYKGHHWLIEAMKSVNATLRIVGSGPLEAELRQQAKGLDIEFLGNVADENLPALYRDCDLFVLPSITPNEAFGVVQLEAMAAGKPVICCDLKSGVPWVNQHGVTGLVVPPRDADALAAAIRKLLEDRELARWMGEAGRARVAAEFTEERMIDSYYGLFAKLAA